jgi:sugar phosphate isomerase/epimerase
MKPSAIENLMHQLDYSPSLTIHAPFMDLSPGAVDEKVRAITIQRFSQILDIAEIIKPKAVVFHSGYEKWKYALKVDTWLKPSLHTWKILNKRALDLGIKIAIENVFEDEPGSLKLLIEEIGSENFGICFDTGHFNLFSKMPLECWMEHLMPYILELHLHDNNKEADDHDAIGEGTFEFNALFDLLKGRDLIYTIEAHSPEAVLTSMKRLEKYQLSP